MNLPFENPYSGDKDVKRITTDVSSGDYYLIKSTRPGLATITGTLGILWKKLCHELRKRNITDYTHVSEFEQFVANCTISAGPEGDGRGRTDGAIGGSNDASPPFNVRGGTPSTSPSDSSTSPVLPDIQSGGGKRSRKKT